MGWLLLAFGLVVQALTGAAEGYARYGLLARPGTLPAATFLAMLASVTFIPGLGCIGFILLLTPTGLPPSPRWRRWVWIAAALPAAFVVAWLLGMPAVDPESVLHGVRNPFAIPVLEGPLRVVAGVTAPLTALTLVVAGWSLVGRFRRARGTERQQLRWLSFAAALAPVAVLVMYAGVLTGNLELAGWAVGLLLALLPLAISAAIARYRLYDLDRIISRTLAYGLLTVLLGGSYVLVVLVLGQLLGPNSPLVVAAATLAVAAVFQPARRRVQREVDRRFNRRRHDAVGIIEGFSSRLRQQVDLDTLSSELLAVVDQTMQPTRTSLWLRPREVQSQPSVVAARRTVAATSGSPSTRWGTESGSRRLPSR